MVINVDIRRHNIIVNISSTVSDEDFTANMWQPFKMTILYWDGFTWEKLEQDRTGDKTNPARPL